MRNMRLSLWIAVALIAVTGMMSSCIEDGFTTSPSDVLAFNKDTVTFDTVITLQGTATTQMVVYNRSKKQINISSIKVAGLTSKGHFHLNVDGIRGDEFHNVEIRGNDSIYIFIEAFRYTVSFRNKHKTSCGVDIDKIITACVFCYSELISIAKSQFPFCRQSAPFRSVCC